MGNNAKRPPERLQQVVDAFKIHGTKKAAADACGLSPSTFKDAYDQAIAEGFTPSSYIPDPPEPVHDIEESDPESDEPADHVEIRKLRDTITQLRSRVTEAERRAAESADYRTAVLDLAEIPAKPQTIKMPKGKRDGGSRTLFAFLSDLHFGEVVTLEEMDGLNSYNQDIAKARLARFFNIIAELATDYWQGAPPDEIVIWIGGDLISGALHPELVATDDLTIPEAVKTAGEHIAGGLLSLYNATGLPIRAHESVGNHGRATMKPQAKMVVRNSFDALALDFAEVALKNVDADISFYRTSSIDTVVPIYGWNFLCTHGDRMGAGGGRGYIGAAAPITKGHQKLISEYAKLDKRPYAAVTGHFHTTMRSPWGWGNGSFPGWNEFARQNRLEIEGAQQSMLVVESGKGVISEHDLFLGHPDEGALYRA